MAKKFDVTGDDLKVLRKRQGLTQGVVAEKIGVKRQTLGNWENGVGEPPSGTIFRMLKIFGVQNLAPLLEEIHKIVAEETTNKK